MAFEFVLTTDEIREKMFDFLKLKENDELFEYHGINWKYGVYDKESGIFLVLINYHIYIKEDYKYIVVTDKGDIFNVMTEKYNKNLCGIPEQFSELSDIIKEGIKTYNDNKLKKIFHESLSNKQKSRITEIQKNMLDRFKPEIAVNSEDDAKRLFNKSQLNCLVIERRYNKKTFEDFNKFASEEKMRIWRGEKYVDFIKKVSEYKSPLSNEQYKQMSNEAHLAGIIFSEGIDDTYDELTLKAIKNAYFRGISIETYIFFVGKYVRKYIKTYSEKIKNLAPLLDFLDTYCDDEKFKSIEFFRKELTRLIYNRVYGFNFVLTTDEIREKMFNFLKPEIRFRSDRQVISINWKYGVYDRDNGIFLTIIYYVPDGIARCGKDYYSYIVITDNGDIFRVDNNNVHGEGWKFSIPDEYSYLSDKIKEGIKLYEQHFSFDVILSEETIEELKKIEENMFDRCRKNFEINCKDDARNLFVLNDCCQNYIYEVYNRKTVENFRKYATDENIFLWREKEHDRILTELCEYYDKHHDEEYNYRQTERYFSHNFMKIKNLMWNGIRNLNIELLCNVIRSISDNISFFRFTFWQVFSVRQYVEYYLKNNPDGKQNIMPLINLIKERGYVVLYNDLKAMLDKDKE